MTVMSLSEFKMGANSCKELKVCGQLVDLCNIVETPALASTLQKNMGAIPNT